MDVAILRDLTISGSLVARCQVKKIEKKRIEIDISYYMRARYTSKMFTSDLYMLTTVKYTAVAQRRGGVDKIRRGVLALNLH